MQKLIQATEQFKYEWCYLGNFHSYNINGAPLVSRRKTARTGGNWHTSSGCSRDRMKYFWRCSDKVVLGTGMEWTQCHRCMENCQLSTQGLDQKTGKFICAWSKYRWHIWLTDGLLAKGAQIFKKSGSLHKLLGITSVITTKFQTKDAQISGATAQNSVTMAKMHLGFVHLWC